MYVLGNRQRANSRTGESRDAPRTMKGSHDRFLIKIFNTDGLRVDGDVNQIAANAK